MTSTLDAPVARPPTRPAARPCVRRMRYEPEPGTLGAVPARQTSTVARDVATVPRDDHDAVRRAVAAALRMALEVLDGRRPPAQLAHHLDAAALRYWRAAAHRRRVRTPARVVRMLVCLPRVGAAEVAAVCDIDGRVRALAARFERADHTAAWRCTVLRLG